MSTCTADSPQQRPRPVTAGLALGSQPTILRTNSILGVKVGTQRALCLLGEKGILTLRGNDTTLGFLGSAYQPVYRKRDS